MSKLWIAAVLLLAALVVVFVTVRMVHRDVRTGKFHEFEIGMSKDEALNIIFNVVGANSISARSREAVEATAQNLQNLNYLKSAEQILVNDKAGLVVSFDVHDNTIDNLRVSSVRNLKMNLFEGQGIEDAIAILRQYLAANPDAIASEGIVGYGYRNRTGEVLRSERATQKGRAAEDWLKTKNIWSFRKPDAYKHYVLHFGDGAITRIEFWNTFGELP